MGFFSQTVTTVGTSVNRLLDDDAIVSSILKGWASSQNPEEDPELVPNILEHMVEGIGVKSNLMFAYAKKAYTNGIPEGTLQDTSKGQKGIESYYKDVIGRTIVTDYYHYGSLNLTHYGWDILFNYMQYNPNTNVIGSISSVGKQCFLKSIQAIITTASQAIITPASLAQWGPPPQAGNTPEYPYQTPGTGSQLPMPVYLVDPAATVDKIRITYVWKKPTGEIVEEHIDSAVEDWSASQSDWHHFRGHPVDNPSATFVITYEDGSGDVSPWNGTFLAPLVGNGTYFPWAYLRFSKTRQDLNTASAEFKTTKRMLKYINLDYSQLIESIHGNPDIADVEQAIVMMAVPAKTKNKQEQHYLYDFFSAQYIQTGASGTKLTPALYDVAGFLNYPVIEHSINIQDKKFNTALTFRNILKRKVVGSIGRVGSYSHAYTTQKFTKDGHLIGTTTDTKVSYEYPCHSYMHQVSEDLYWEVMVFNLKMKYRIFNEYWTTGDETDDILMIPIDHSISQTYSIQDREILLARSLHLVFNSRVVTKLKWYQTEAFKIILVIVAIILIVYSLGTFARLYGVVAGVIAGEIAVSTLVSLILTGIIKAVVVRYAVRLFVKAVGPKLAFIAAIVALVAAFVSGNPQAVGGSGIAGAPWAISLMEVSTGLIKGAQEDILESYQDLLAEERAFKTYAEKETARLKKADEQLRGQSNILAPLIIIGESPTDFYSRTIHSGNIGIAAIDAIQYYVDNALRLPTFNDTIGYTFNG